MFVLFLIIENTEFISKKMYNTYDETIDSCGLEIVLPSYNSKIENEKIALGLVLAKNSKSLTFSNVFFTFTQVIPQLT